MIASGGAHSRRTYIAKKQYIERESMIANYEHYGFKVTAEELLETCTACPFWLSDMKTLETGMCFLTGHEIAADGQQDEKRMDDCMVEERKKE